MLIREGALLFRQDKVRGKESSTSSFPSKKDCHDQGSCESIFWNGNLEQVRSTNASITHF